MKTGFSVIYRMTAAEFAAGTGVGLTGGFIEIVDTNGTPTGAVYVTGVTGAPPEPIAGSVLTRLAVHSTAQWSAVVDVDGVNCDHADAASITTCGKLVGVAANTAGAGAAVQIITHGDITGYAGLAVGPVYLGTAGALTSVVPTTGVLLKLGYVAASNIFVVDVQQPIVLS